MEENNVADNLEMELAEKGDLIKALAAAKAEFPHVAKTATATIKTKTGGTYGYSYATLDVIRAACDPVLSKFGLVVLHITRLRPSGKLLLISILWHESGQFIMSEWPLMSDPGDPQKVASDMTYGMRYEYCGLAGIAAGSNDDDGAQATGKPNKPKPKPKPASESKTPTTTHQPTQGQRTRGIISVLAKEFGVGTDLLESYAKDKGVFPTTANATFVFKQALDDTADSEAGPRMDLFTSFNAWLVKSKPQADNTESAPEPATEQSNEGDINTPNFDTLVTALAKKMAVDDAALGAWVAANYEDPDTAEKDLNLALTNARALSLLRKKFMAAGSADNEGG